MTTDPHTACEAPGRSRPGIQSGEELDEFYTVEDPWDYDTTADDQHRVARLLAAIPRREYGRTLDIGCGNGFVTSQLPGGEVLGVDVSQRAVHWARERAVAAERPELSFEVSSIFDLDAASLGLFDLIVITGVLYPQYVGRGHALVTEILRGLLRPGWVLVTAHIDSWTAYRPPFTTLSISVDRYRQYFHRLEVFQR